MPTKIEWAEETWNPLTGCSPVSDGCRNCYAERIVKRFPNLHGLKTEVEYLEPFGRPGFAISASRIEIRSERKTFQEIHFHPDRLEKPLRWKKARKIFVCSMSDLFHEDVTDEQIGAVLFVISGCSRHTFMILTKRPERMKTFFEQHNFGALQGQALATFGDQIPHELVEEGPALNGVHGAWPLPNLWLGVTAENQFAAERRIPVLLKIPAAKRFVSVEPMLGQVERTAWAVDWVICGGESGPGARPMQGRWALSLRDQCRAAGVPFFFKQWGEFNSAGKRVGKKAAGRLLEGRKHDEWPEV